MHGYVSQYHNWLKPCAGKLTMAILLDYYSTYGPSGKIYVRCAGAPPRCRIDYHLYLDGERVQSKTAYGDELIAFLYSSPATYQVHADIHPEREASLHLRSAEIIPVIHDIFPHSALGVKPIKGPVALVGNQQNFLVVKFCKGGIKKLNIEHPAVVPCYYPLRQTIRFVRSYDKKVIDNIVKHSPELDGLRYVYSVEPDLANQVLLALANELQRLDYIEYCSLSDKLGDLPTV